MDKENMKYQILKKYFGYSSFRGQQEKAIDSLLSGHDVLCVMPTGAGKSLCYQIPALMYEGISLVVSPLISLMNDQVMSLVSSGVRAAYINSSLSSAQYEKVLENIEAYKYKIIYVAPERLQSLSFLRVCNKVKISFIAVDEAHCVSQWGQDFRPGYLNIRKFINSFDKRPVAGAFTATATDKVKKDITELLGLKGPDVITTGFDRPNLYFSVINSASKDSDLINLIYERRGQSGIVYCATRKAVDEVSAMLRRQGFSALKYHAGLDGDIRIKNQQDFTFDRSDIMVATNAFGMGIDKSNISYVIHYNMPKDLESYYQEAGRAGRDGKNADCILLYSPGDVHLNKFLIENSERNEDLSTEQIESVREKELERLKQMTYYCTSKTCLRHFILRYFGEKSPYKCDNCSVCKNNKVNSCKESDVLAFVRCVNLSGQRFGKSVICKILKGSTDDRIIQYGLDRLAVFGSLRDKSLSEIYSLADYLKGEKYIVSEGDKYPVLKLGPAGRRLIKENISYKESVPSSGSDLFEALKKLRAKLASVRGVPPYIIASDAALDDMCRKKPASKADLYDIKGMSDKKIKLYGLYFISEIGKYL